MLRPTHFVLLFAVFACAYAVPVAEGPAAAPDDGPSPEQLISVPDGAGVVVDDKSDLDTDASHWYSGYYRPRWSYGGWGGRGYGWGGGWGGGWRHGWGGGWGSRYWY